MKSQFGVKQFVLVGVLISALGCQSPRVAPVIRPLPPMAQVHPEKRMLPVRATALVPARPGDYLQVLAGGDVMLGHWLLEYLKREGADYPFRRIRHLMQTGDVVFANLEAPFADSGVAVEKTYTFRVPTRYAIGLKQAGLNVVSLANNHILDFGMGALEQTLRALDRVKVRYAGAGRSLDDAWRPAILNTHAGRVAVLAFSMTFPKSFWATDSTGGTAYPHEDRLVQVLDSLDREVDFVIVSFHWGAEKRETPKDYQIYFARLAIDHGADLVLGHHPHVLQGLELYKNRLIAYSLGNLAFASYSKVARQSMLLKVLMHRRGLLFARIYPLNIDNTEVEFQPTPAQDPLAAQIIAKVDSLSRPLNAEDIIDDSGFIWGRMFPHASYEKKRMAAFE